MKVQDLQGRHTGVVIFGEHDKGTQSRIEVRAFAPAHGVNEDPVCGSGNGSIGAYIRQTDQVKHFGETFFATQGAAVGRAGVLRLTVNESKVRVGGNAVTCVWRTYNLTQIFNKRKTCPQQTTAIYKSKNGTAPDLDDNS
jgi:PhzF family phenazine biosynthesis protein